MGITSRTCNYERMNVERLAARGFTALGGFFWVAAAFGGLYFYKDLGITEAIGGAVIPLVIAIAAFAIGWFYERLAAVILGAGAAAIVVWGLAGAWEMGSWLGMLVTVVGPMLGAAILFWLASRMEEVCRLAESTG